ncbi:hypothetical protein RI129_000104 [Pyrocoelia pectoralis]|uniref:Lipase domain-containing protein n=1 Tax=Pyrocoelia pectoralis TaxID=417401 RepID=A0AAN7UZC0_9COLE
MLSNHSTISSLTSNPTVAERLPYSETTRIFSSKYFRFNRKLKLIVHGYLESGEEQWIKQMAGAWLNREDVNVISVNWALGATPPYTQAVANTRLVGAIIAHLLRLVQDATPTGYSLNNIHIIGHSLGAHIAGYTGSSSFVDVVHTDVSNIMSGGFGMNQTCGHVDFYPNGASLSRAARRRRLRTFGTLSRRIRLFSMVSNASALWAIDLSYFRFLFVLSLFLFVYSLALTYLLPAPGSLAGSICRARGCKTMT